MSMEPSERTALESTLASLDRQTKRLAIRWLLIGAAGRDLILEETTGRRPARATHDVDVAVLATTWDDYTALRNALVEQERATNDRDNQQRLYLPNGSPLDLIPFGGLEQESTVAWPPDGEPILNVRGLQEAMVHSISVNLKGEQEVQIPSIEMFLCLKLLAWKDRHAEKPMHDSVDLGEVLSYAEDIISLDELHERHVESFAANEWDAGLTVMQVLGERLQRILRPETSSILSAILVEELDEEGRLTLVRELGSDRTLPKLRALLQGLQSRGPGSPSPEG